MKSKRSMRTSTRPKLRQKLTWQYAAAGIAVVVIVAACIFAWLNFGNNRDIKAAAKDIIYSKQNGEWDQAASWDPRIPQSGDSVVLKKEHKIKIMETKTYEAIRIAVNGTLWIDHASKLNLTQNSRIEVFGPSGAIDGGKEDGKAGSSKSTRIEYNGKSIWDTSMGAVSGYSLLDENGYAFIGTLPVSLAYFKVRPEAGSVLVEWATEAEENNDFFNVERSTDGKTFQTLTTVEGAGNSTAKLTYFYTDSSPLAGKSYYRLKQTDYDGKFEYFKLEMVENNSANTVKSTLNVQRVGPNPFQDHFFVDYDLGTEGPVEIRLMNMNGQVMATEVVDGYSGSNRFDFNNGSNLQNGTYMLTLTQNSVAAKPVRLIKN